MNAHTLPLVRSTQRRLFLLLVRAFAIVVLLTTGLLLGMTGFVISHTAGHSLISTTLLPVVLEAYYAGHGSWEGVENLFNEQGSNYQPEFLLLLRQTILVDSQGQVILRYGEIPPVSTSQVYIPSEGETQLFLSSNGETVGELVFSRVSVFTPWRVAFGLLLPVAGISVFLGLLTLVIGLLLMRRVVYPLAEVIAAARSVAGGDLSTRVKVQGPDDLRALSDSFNHMADALQNNEQERRNLLADVAHELRTPLTVLRGRLEGILDRVYPADETHIAPALEETYLLERLVDDLRLLTLAEGGQLHFDLKPVNLGELACQSADVFDPQAKELQVLLAVEVEESLPLVRIDAQRTAQVIGNLLSNALNFSAPQGKITIRVGASNGHVRLTVSDTGPGLPEADLMRIFDRFWRGEKSRSRQYGGSGLGLAIARQLIEAQAGRIFAENNPEGGLRVGFELPV
jgi:signal transduction histidine kinase